MGNCTGLCMTTQPAGTNDNQSQQNGGDNKQGVSHESMKEAYNQNANMFSDAQMKQMYGE